ncbi:MAG: hypothetical protein HFJ94_03565 [Muribaculaceae bacterium]|nr:hypothetical protein [Muribaculaceae bacterium]
MMHIKQGSIVLLFSILLASCGGRSPFTAEVKIIEEPKEMSDLTMEKVESEYVYSLFFSVCDSILISSTPGVTDYNFHVADIKNHKELGSFMHRGEGPAEYLGLTPIYRIEKKNEELVALTFDPFKKRLLEWNISKSIELGRDSITFLGYYKDSNEYGLTYARIYRLGEDKYLGRTPGMSFLDPDTEPLLPSYWFLEGFDNAPTHGISILKRPADNIESYGAPGACLSPDKSKVVEAMGAFAQINIVDLEENTVKSYRMAGSPDESNTADSDNKSYEFQDVASDVNSIYALYCGESPAAFQDKGGCLWLYQFDWDGNIEKKYLLPIAIRRLWMDLCTNTLYGYCGPEDAIYKLNINE